MFPDSVDTYEVKVDERITGISKEQTATLDSTLQVWLAERPAEESVTVTGAISWTEVAYEPYESGQFCVNYNTGEVRFFSSDEGRAVSISYTGLGSPLRALDFTEVQGAVERTQEAVLGLLGILAGTVSAEDPKSASVEVSPGTVYPTPKIPVVLAGGAVDFSSTPYLLDALTPSYWCPILLVVDPSGNLVVIQGTESAVETGYTFSADFERTYEGYLVLAEIHVRDNGTGGPGTINPVAAAKIFDRRPLVFSGAQATGALPPVNSVVLWPAADPVPDGWLQVGSETLSLGGVSFAYIQRQ